MTHGSRIKIMLVSGSLPPMKCGVGDYTRHLAESLAKHKHISTVVVVTSKAAAEYKSASLEILPIIGPWNCRAVWRVLRLAKGLKPDIVHIQYPTRGYGRKISPSWLPAILRLARFRVVQTWHEPLSWKGWLRYFPNALTRDALIVAEPDFKERLPRIYRWLIKQKAFKYIPVGSAIPKAEITQDERAALRAKYVEANGRLLVYFGFASPTKGIEQIFAIADPASDRIILLCELNEGDEYHERILALVNDVWWLGKVYVTGFLPAPDVANILAVADAVVLPFTNGAGSRNTTLLAAQMQGTFVLTTHNKTAGLDADQNTFYAPPNATDEMRRALQKYAGRKTASGRPNILGWSDIADLHLQLYQDQIGSR